MSKKVIDLDVYVPDPVYVIIGGIEYEIPVPPMSSRIRFINASKAIAQGNESGEIENVVSAMVDICEIAIPGIEREILMNCTEVQLGKIVELVQDQFGATGREDEENSKNSL